MNTEQTTKVVNLEVDMSDTPRTDAAVIASAGQWSYELRDCSRQLERELAAAQAETAKWKAAHDNQVKIKSILIQRPDLGDRAKRIERILTENLHLNEITSKNLITNTLKK